MLAQDDGKRSEFERALATGKENAVELSSKIPVRLLYHTAYVQDGRVLFRTDPYGWDEDLARSLGMEARPHQRLRTHVSIAGP